MISAYLQWLDDVIENNRWNPGVFSRHFECKPLSCRFILGNLRIYFHFLVFHFSQYYNDATSWDLSLGTCLCCMVNTMATDDLVTSVTGQGINRIGLVFPEYSAFYWRHNDHDGASNHQHNGCLLNRLFRRRSKKTSKLRVTGLCVGNSPGPVNSPHKGPVTRKMFPFDDVII